MRRDRLQARGVTKSTEMCGLHQQRHFAPQRTRLKSLHALLLKALRARTCSGLSPGGTQAYSSKAQPESSSEVEFLWKSYMSLVTVFSISTGMAVTACSSRRHLQCTQIFLPGTRDKRAFGQSDSRRALKYFNGVRPKETTKGAAVIEFL